MPLIRHGQVVLNCVLGIKHNTVRRPPSAVETTLLFVSLVQRVGQEGREHWSWLQTLSLTKWQNGNKRLGQGLFRTWLHHTQTSGSKFQNLLKSIWLRTLQLSYDRTETNVSSGHDYITNKRQVPKLTICRNKSLTENSSALSCDRIETNVSSGSRITNKHQV